MATRKYYDIAVIGGGPAGLSAAYEAAQSGARVCLVDENRVLGGQLFKQIHKFFGSREHRAGVRGFRIAEELVQHVMTSGVDVFADAVCWGMNPGYELGVTVGGSETFVLEPKKIILCTGAAENALAFPGSTLPGIIGAGAAQTLMNIRKVRPGRRAVVVGSGNVGLIVSYQLMQAGVDVAAVVEAAPRIGGYAVHAAKIKRLGVEILCGHTVLEAFGETQVSGVAIAAVDENFSPIEGTERTIDCDLVAIAAGLHPMVDVCRMAGCETTYDRALGGRVPVHDEDMETSLHGIYVAGDVSGVEEASIAIEEGRLAGIACAESLGYIPAKDAAVLKDGIRASLADLRSAEKGAPVDAPGKGALAALLASGKRAALIECLQNIPCNPCETSCPQGAITVGAPITNRPQVDIHQCIGCGICVAVCPGLAIFLAEQTTEDTAELTFAYEFLPVPEKGTAVTAVDRDGKEVCAATVVRVMTNDRYDHTHAVTIRIPLTDAESVRGIRRLT